LFCVWVGGEFNIELQPKYNLTTMVAAFY